MKELISTLAVVLILATACAQQVSFDVGRILAGYQYTDSKGKSLDNLFGEYNFSYSIGYRHEASTFLYPTASIVYSTYAVYGSDAPTGNTFSWSTGYLGVALGAEGEVYRRGALHILLRAALEPQWMTRGVQTINGEVMNLKGAEQFDNPFMFFRGGAGVNYCLEPNIALSLKYLYGLGFPLGNDPTGEELRMRTSAIYLGLLIGLGRTSYCHPSRFK